MGKPDIQLAARSRLFDVATDLLLQFGEGAEPLLIPKFFAENDFQLLSVKLTVVIQQMSFDA
jgi:hypothetical protein